jgi:DNA-binding MarR family transcriptional regulator
MSLQDQILKIVQSTNGIKAREIAKQLDADKSDVNSLL